MAPELKIAIQGGTASFHDMAARQYFAAEPVVTLPCMSFRLLCNTLQAGICDYALMAIENVVAGTLLTNLTLLQQYDFNIIGEIWLPIEQNIMALPGQKLEDIKLVSSHPVAILQCGSFLNQHPHLQAQETVDTAESARHIREKELAGVAAIASRQAADFYELTILEENIADIKENYTRFLVLSKAPVKRSELASKASLILELPYLNGSIGTITDQLHKLRIDVSLAESLPGPTSNPAHFAAIDIVSDNCGQLLKAIDALEPLVKSSKILGLYPKAFHPLKESNKALSLKPVN